MTAVIAQPQAKAQDIVAMNVNLMISARHIQKKDLAKALGIAPQTISKKLRSEITWTINETQAAADFLNTDVATLLNPSLTQGELLGYKKTAASDDSENGGLSVAGHGFEPWTSGDTRGPRFKSMGLLSLSELILTA
mgnify:CR=1 FL=1